MITINIQTLSPKKAQEIFNEFAGKEYINTIDCNYSYNFNSSVTLESNSNDIVFDLAGYFS